MDLARVVRDFADALRAVDAKRQAHKSFKPGIGPFGEADAAKAAIAEMKSRFPEIYGYTIIRRQPDLLIPDRWQIELKVLRPYGDNGREAENWSQNLLHPYPGNVSSIGDCLKLLSSGRTERRAILVFGYEHDPARIALDPCIAGFELLARTLFGIRLSERVEEVRKPLVHPEHQVLRMFGWEVLGQEENGHHQSS